MTLEILRSKVKEVRNLIDKNLLADAFALLEKIVVEEGNYNVADRLKQAKQTYGYMIHYLLEGVEDNSRDIVYDQTVNTLREISDDLLIDKQMTDSPEIYFSTSRICKHRNLELNDLLNRLVELRSTLQLIDSGNPDYQKLHAEYESLLREAFDTIWTERRSKDLCNVLVDHINSGIFDTRVSTYFISALFLSLIAFYDKNKFTALLDIYDNADTEDVAASAMVCILFVLDRYRERINKDVKILNRLSLWQDSLLTYSRLRSVIKEIVRTRDTDRVAAVMRDEVLPELMRLRPEMLKKMRESSVDFENGAIENNPMWEEMLEKNGLGDKMRELTEMQSEGADLMMVTFSNLKGFPFFNNVNAWFLPFDIDSPSIKIESEFKNYLQPLLSLDSLMCDSDRYSLVLAFSTMPSQQRDMMFAQFKEQMSQIVENSAELREKQSHPAFIGASVVFIRELYRFFKLFRKKNEFVDPFSDTFDFLRLPVIGEMLADDEMVSLIGEFYFKRGYHKEALSMFREMEQTSDQSPIYWEKVGYSLQSLKRYAEAIEAYRKAELLGDNGQWLLKRLAFLSKQSGDLYAAADYYSRVLMKDSDNVSMLMNLGHVLLDNGDIEGALKSYYHAHYLQSENPKIWRAIGWAELVGGNYEKSWKYYDKILGNAPESIDFLNAGHLKLVMHKYKEAIDLYNKAANGDIAEFTSLFAADKETLMQLGVPELTQHLVLDSIKMGKKEI